VSAGLCGAARPGHFDGVATVVAKLLLQCRPDLALFGEKDFQQLKVIEQMATDLDLAIEIAGITTVREADGLALSSRNRYLGPDERAVAPTLYRTLGEIAVGLKAGGAAETLCATAAAALVAAGFLSVDYLEVRDQASLAPAPGWQGRPLRVLAAARLGGARLIDNIGVI